MYQCCPRRCRCSQLQYLLANPSLVNDDGIAMQSLYSRITGILISGADSGFMFNVCTFRMVLILMVIFNPIQSLQVALDVLEHDPGLQELLPHICRFVYQKVGDCYACVCHV
jgi:hypothetical protein